MAPLIALALKLLPFAGAVPEVIRALGGDKAAEAAEKVVSLAQTVTGTTTGDDALQALQSKPELALEYAKVMSTERLEFARLALEETKAYLGDVQDARRRDIEVRKVSGGYNWRADLLIVGCIVALCYIVNRIGMETVKPEVLAIFNMAIGALLKMLGDVFSYEFGSSRGSKEKGDLLRR